MKKPVAEVNVKVFSEKNGHYKADTSVSLNSDDLEVVLIALETLDNLSKNIINEKTKEFVRNIFKGAITDDELEKLIIDTEKKECTR